MEDKSKPVTDRSALPEKCYHCGAVDRKLIYEPDDAQAVRGICVACRRERDRGKSSPRAESK